MHRTRPSRVLALSFGALAAALFAPGCVLTKSINSGSQANEVFPPTVRTEIPIYRSTRPKNSFQEIGTVSVVGTCELPVIFDRMRTEAARKGATAVIGFQLDSRISRRLVTHTSRGPNGATSTSSAMQNVVSYSATGTMIREKGRTGR